MENITQVNKPSMFQPALQYGLLIAVGLTIITLITYLAGVMTSSWTSYLTYAVLLVGIILGTLKFRDGYSGGFISYKRALGFGTLTAFLAGIITAILGFIFYQYLAPDAIDEMRAATEKEMLAQPGITDQQIDMALQFVSPLMLALTTLLSLTFLGFIFSLVTSVFVKKNEPEFDELTSEEPTEEQ